jgi:DNA-binding PadR family transcriptional regulator
MARSKRDANGTTKGDLIRGAADLVVLSVLADGPLYGYAITKRIAAQSDGVMNLGAGALYPLLHQMERDGLLIASWDAVRSSRGVDDDDEPGGRRRKWYRLSARGRRRLAKRIDAHRAYQALIESFLPGVDEEGAVT